MDLPISISLSKVITCLVDKHKRELVTVPCSSSFATIYITVKCSKWNIDHDLNLKRMAITKLICGGI
jgi:hypothetical protein